MSSGGKWILEVYLVRPDTKAPVVIEEFDNLPQLRLALANIRDHKFIVQLPDGVTAEDRKTLLDLRSQGFDIATDVIVGVWQSRSMPPLRMPPALRRLPGNENLARDLDWPAVARPA